LYLSHYWDAPLWKFLTVKDSEFMLELLNDPAWLQFIGDRGVRTLDDARDYILQNLVESSGNKPGI
jgi:hypothetical protein